jgi:transcriptional regulator with XRE-family HTH domain
MNELGRTLHAWRDRVTPAEAGLPTGGRRRAPGLRREELALLAGLSVDYIIRLEQGRSDSPSVQVLTALSRALRLSDAERNHLFVVAGQVQPLTGRISAHIPASVQRIVDQLDGTPLCVYDASWTLITWNALGAALLGDPSGWTGRNRNIIWRAFAGEPHARIRQTPEQLRSFFIATVTDLRASVARYPNDRELATFVEDLRECSAEFAALWDQPVIGFHRSEHKTIEHPELGIIGVDSDVLTVPGSDLRMVLYTAVPGSEAAEKLRLLSVIGLQTVS